MRRDIVSADDAGRIGGAIDGSAAGASAGEPAAIDIEGLRFRYAGAAAPVLDGCDWNVPAGAFALLVGDTGSGKSTLLSLLKPEIAPAGELAGTVRVLGRPVGEMEPAESAASVGYVFQNPENQIVCESVWHEIAFGLENLGLAQDEMRRRIAETSYFFGLDDWFRDETDTLSGGRKQLLSLASVLVMRPRLLLLDEPTSQLDPVAEKNFLHALFRVNRELGCTVVAATHRPQPMLDYATCAYRIEGGRVHEVADLASLGGRARLLAGEPRGRSRAARTGLVCELRDGWFRYGRDGAWVMRGCSTEFAAGRIHAIAGGNGCGKSTLLSVLAKTAKLQRGRYRRAAASSALLPQNPKALLVAETVSDELIEWAPSCGYSDKDAREMLRRVGLAGLESRHPYDLSGGQQQLLALAKLMLVGPELLLLDEPTKGLDLASRRVVARILREHADAGGTVIMATHDLDFAEQVADDVALMFDGEFACMEPTEEFFRGNMFFRP